MKIELKGDLFNGKEFFLFDVFIFVLAAGNDGHHFSIDPEKGSLIIAKPLVWSIQNLYNLTVTITDGIHSASEWVSQSFRLKSISVSL